MVDVSTAPFCHCMSDSTEMTSHNVMLGHISCDTPLVGISVSNLE